MINGDEIRAIQERILEENHPSGICLCGCPQRDHGGMHGHGECYGTHISGEGRCTSCLKFTWVKIDPEIERLIENAIVDAKMKAELRAEAIPAGDYFDL